MWDQCVSLQSGLELLEDFGWYQQSEDPGNISRFQEVVNHEHD